MGKGKTFHKEKEKWRRMKAEKDDVRIVKEQVSIKKKRKKEKIYNEDPTF
jgi:hypothetical protein